MAHMMPEPAQAPSALRESTITCVADGGAPSQHRGARERVRPGNQHVVAGTQARPYERSHRAEVPGSRGRGRSGASWTDIGKSMGVSKQAAQKRFVPKPDAVLDPDDLGRFTPRAKNVVRLAQEEARAAGNPEVRAEHLVLGLLSDQDSLAAKAIVAQGITLDAVRQAAFAALPPKAGSVPDAVLYAATARKVLELTFREALRLGHNYIGTEHVLLGLLEHEGDAGVLTDLGVDKADVEANVLAALAQVVANRPQ